MSSSAKPLTFTYKTLADTSHNIDLDVHLPQVQSSADRSRPTMIWFHGGGGLVGDKGIELHQWFPVWAIDLITKRNDWIFISANYRLLAPSTGYDILEDIKDVFTFVATELASKPIGGSGLKVDAKRLMIGGESFGGYCARLGALYADPKPRVMLSMYGMGGQLLTPFYTAGRTVGGPIPTFNNMFFPHPDPAMESLLHPPPSEVLTSAKTGLDEHGAFLSPRLSAFLYTFQLGVWVDYLLGKPGFSAGIKDKVDIRSIKESDVPADVMVLFPEFAPASSYPPSVLIHGTADSVVLASESAHTASQLQATGVKTLHIEVAGDGHGFDTTEDIKVEDGNEIWEKMKGREIEAFLRATVTA